MHPSLDTIYAFAGAGLAILGGSFAFMRSRSTNSVYAVDVYGMTARSHRNFTGVSAAFVLVFLIVTRIDALVVPLLALYTLLLLFYVTSFFRGFSGEDE